MAQSVIRGAEAFGADAVYASSGATATKYTPELFSAKALKNFYEVTVFGSIANTDYAGEIKNQGDKVWIRTSPTVAITPYEVGDVLTYASDTHTAARELNIDQGLSWAFQQEDVNDVQSALDVMNMASNDAGERMAIAVDANVLKYIAVGATETSLATSFISTDNWGPTCGAITGTINMGDDTPGFLVPRVLTDSSTAATDIIKALVDMNQVLDEQNIPAAGRWVVLPAWAYSLLKTGDIRRADITGDGTGVIRNGAVGMIDGLTIYRSNNLYTDPVVPANTYIPFGINEAVTFASQFTKTETLRIQDQFGDYYRGLNVFGRAVVQPTALGCLYAVAG